MKCWIEDAWQSGRKMVGELQHRAESLEWRVGLNNDRRYLLVLISPASPESIVTSLARDERDSTALLIRFV